MILGRRGFVDLKFNSTKVLMVFSNEKCELIKSLYLELKWD